MLVGILQHSQCDAGWYDDTFSLQGGGRIGDQLRLEGWVAPGFSDDPAEFRVNFRHSFFSQKYQKVPIDCTYAGMVVN
jgi:hypothetical protein